MTVQPKNNNNNETSPINTQGRLGRKIAKMPIVPAIACDNAGYCKGYCKGLMHACYTSVIVLLLAASNY